MVKKTEDKLVEKQALELVSINAELVGLSDLMVNRMSDKTKQGLKDKMEGKSKSKENRNFEDEAQEKIHYVLIKGKKVPAIPTYAVKSALVEVAPYMKDLDMKKVKRTIIVESVDGNDLIPFRYKKMELDERFARPRFGAAPMPVIRPRFKDWSCEVKITFNKALITPETIINLLNLAGFHNGLGSFSPRSNGNFGRFAVKVK